MNKKLFFLLLFLLLLTVITVSFVYGPVKISILQIIDILLNKLGINYSISDNSFTKMQSMVLLNIRLPRILLAILVGVGLGTSGAILQGLFRNPLVDPGFIGVSSGAAVGAMIAIMFSNFFTTFISENLISFMLPILAIIGSFVTTLMVYILSRVHNKTNIMAMLLSGIAINALSGALIGIFVSISSDSQLRSFTFWTLGGLDNADWFIVLLTGIVIVISLFFIFKIRSQLDIFMLGDAEAAHLGVDVEFLKKKIILISSLMVGISVSFCGMIGFIGLITPHLVRMLIGPNHQYLIPASALLGSLLLATSDIISKSIISPAQLPIGVVTSCIGAPFFIWLIYNQKKRLSFV